MTREEGKDLVSQFMDNTYHGQALKKIQTLEQKLAIEKNNLRDTLEEIIKCNDINVLKLIAGKALAKIKQSS